MLKRVCYKILAVFSAMYSFAFFCAGIAILIKEDVKQGKLLGFIIAMVGGILLGLAAKKLFRMSRKVREQTIVSPPVVKNIKSSQELTHNSPLNNSPIITATIQRQEIPQQIVQENKTNVVNKRTKCNCDGCPKQGDCQYGHIIYDEITKERMTLFDKFMMLHTFECEVSPNDFGIIATNEETHNRQLLLKLDKEVLYNTLNYLQEVKKAYLAFGKCGRSYFNFMKMGDEILLVKEVIKEIK